MFDKLEIFDKRFEELNKRMYEPDVAADPVAFREVNKELSSITPIVEKYREYKGAKQAIEDALSLLDDSSLDDEMKELAQLELSENKENIAVFEEELKILLLPKDPNDERNVIVEIRGGTGGEESSLFASDLFRMYSMYAESKRWHIDITNANETELGGYKEISFMIEGTGAYSRFHI